MAQPVFPQNIKEWTDKQDHIDDVFAGDINGAYAELIAIQKYLKPLIDTGVANAYSATVPNVTEYFDGLMVTLKIANSNTGSSTLNINDLGAKPIKKEKDVDLAANDIKAGQYVTFVYDGTNFQMVSAVNGLVSHKDENASTSKKGHVQLTDSVSSTSTTTAATPNSVKQAYDKANAALPKSGGTMTGILTAQSNTSYTVRQVRNIILSTEDADVDAMQNGDIWIKYK